MDGVTTGLTMGKLKDVMIDMQLAWLEMTQTAMLTPPAKDKSLESTGLTYEDLCASYLRRWLGDQRRGRRFGVCSKRIGPIHIDHSISTARKGVIFRFGCLFSLGFGGLSIVDDIWQ
jgi:hypothetical protein